MPWPESQLPPKGKRPMLLQRRLPQPWRPILRPRLEALERPFCGGERIGGEPIIQERNTAESAALVLREASSLMLAAPFLPTCSI